MSSDLSIKHLELVQSLLGSFGISSVFTGEIALLYYGVDAVLHDVELCVPEEKLAQVKDILGSHDEFVTISNIAPPDFYHPHKRGAYQFEFLGLNDRVHLHVVADAALLLDISSSSTSTFTVLANLGEWCRDVDEAVAGKLRFPTLANFLNAWLNLASQEQVIGSVEQSVVFLMQAERLIDANKEVDLAWCRSHIKFIPTLVLAEALLHDQQMRLSQSAWH